MQEVSSLLKKAEMMSIASTALWGCYGYLPKENLKYHSSLSRVCRQRYMVNEFSIHHPWKVGIADMQSCLCLQRPSILSAVAIRYTSTLPANPKTPKNRVGKIIRFKDWSSHLARAKRTKDRVPSVGSEKFCFPAHDEVKAVWWAPDYHLIVSTVETFRRRGVCFHIKALAYQFFGKFKVLWSGSKGQKEPLQVFLFCCVRASNIYNWEYGALSNLPLIWVWQHMVLLDADPRGGLERGNIKKWRLLQGGGVVPIWQTRSNGQPGTLLGCSCNCGRHTSEVQLHYCQPAESRQITLHR